MVTTPNAAAEAAATAGAEPEVIKKGKQDAEDAPADGKDGKEGKKAETKK